MKKTVNESVKAKSLLEDEEVENQNEEAEDQNTEDEEGSKEAETEEGSEENSEEITESGTGKEVLAEYIHEMSERKGKEMVRINCAAFPEKPKLILSSIVAFNASIK